MRELGEGVPRMFEAMEHEGLKPPEFHLQAGAILTVVLHNAPVYSAETIRWLKRFEGQELNQNQKRLLAYAHSHDDRFTSRAFQKLVGVDIYAASRYIMDLRRKGIAQPLKKGGRVYSVSFPGGKPEEVPKELKRCLTRVFKKGYLTNTAVRKILGVNRIQATRLLNEWISFGLLKKRGKGRWTRYEQV
jgi:predicted HTH transcriptional regulator